MIGLSDIQNATYELRSGRDGRESSDTIEPVKTMEKKMENEDPIREQKEIAYFQELISAWTATRMENDKQVLTLSALAIGLLVTFRSEIDDVLAFCVWLLAGVSFLVSILLILLVFRQNSDYIAQIIRETHQGQEIDLDRALRRNTLWAHGLFAFGVFLTIMLAVYLTGFVIVKGA